MCSSNDAPSQWAWHKSWGEVCSTSPSLFLFFPWLNRTPSSAHVHPLKLLPTSQAATLAGLNNMHIAHWHHLVGLANCWGIYYRGLIARQPCLQCLMKWAPQSSSGLGTNARESIFMYIYTWLYIGKVSACYSPGPFKPPDWQSVQALCWKAEEENH